jgi:peptidoglycan hydrolase CwlO-like protein
VLVRACAQGAVCESLEAQLRTLRSQEPPDNEAIGALAAQHAAAAKSLTQLLTTLRATPQQPYAAAHRRPADGKVRTVRPWEVAEEASDG